MLSCLKVTSMMRKLDVEMLVKGNTSVSVKNSLCDRIQVVEMFKKRKSSQFVLGY